MDGWGARMRRTVEELLFENYGELADPILTPLLDWLLAVRSHFSDDLDLFLIFIVVAIRTTGDPRAQAIHFPDVGRGEVPEYPSLLTNTRSIAASTGIPYETTRRKVEQLLASDWIERRQGGLALTVKASEQFGESRRTLFTLVAAYHSLVERLLRRTADAPEQP